jgi:hypothetical protein
MYQDYKDLLSAFRAHGVKYLIVGGFAVIFHAQPRFTKDLDLFVKADLSNAQSLYAALAGLAHRSMTSVRKTLLIAALSFDLGGSRKPSIFYPKFPASILTRHGNVALKP